MSAAKPSLQTWVPRETKKRFNALATRRGMSESKLLALLVDTVLEQNPKPKTPVVAEVDADAEPVKYTVRLLAQDGAQIDARAKGREMRPATYLALLVRAHVRHSLAKQFALTGHYVSLWSVLGEQRTEALASFLDGFAVAHIQGAIDPHCFIALLLPARNQFPVRAWLVFFSGYLLCLTGNDANQRLE